MIDKSKLLELLERHQAGEPITEICRDLGLSRNSIYAYYKSQGKPLRSRFVYQPFKLDKAVRCLVAEQYNNGDSSTQIAKRFGVSHKTITQCVREFGYAIRTVDDNRRRNGHPAIKSALNTYRRSKAAVKFGFTLTYEQFATLLTDNCSYCGAPPAGIRHKGTKIELAVNGIDRLNNTKGYIINNVVTACKWCNFAKNTMTSTEFQIWIHGLLMHQLRQLSNEHRAELLTQLTENNTTRWPMART